MDVRQLRYFIAACEGGSISAAARHCHVAQPSISQAIAQLEEELGVLLLERHPRGITLTDDGRRLYPLARQVCEEMRGITQLFHATPSPTPFRLGLMRSLGADRMSSLLKDFLQRGDDIALTLVNPEEPCDARIIGETERGADELFQPIWHDRFVLALPTGHPLCRTQRIELATLQELPFLWRSPCAGMARLGDILTKAGIHCQVRARLRTIEYSLALVAAGVGVSLVPAWPVVLHRDDICCRRLALPTIDQVIGLAWPRQQLSPPLEILIAQAKQHWQGNQTIREPS